MEFDFISTFPSKKNGEYWELELLPNVGIVKENTEEYAIGIGWLFWMFIIYIEV